MKANFYICTMFIATISGDKKLWDCVLELHNKNCSENELIKTIDNYKNSEKGEYYEKIVNDWSCDFMWSPLTKLPNCGGIILVRSHDAPVSKDIYFVPDKWTKITNFNRGLKAGSRDCLWKNQKI